MCRLLTSNKLATICSHIRTVEVCSKSSITIRLGECVDEVDVINRNTASVVLLSEKDAVTFF